jgi:hypothetical protein
MGRGKQCFGRDASSIQACAANTIFFDYCYRGASLCASYSGGVTARAAADYYNIKTIRHNSSSFLQLNF